MLRAMPDQPMYTMTLAGCCFLFFKLETNQLQVQNFSIHHWNFRQAGTGNAEAGHHAVTNTPRDHLYQAFFTILSLPKKHAC